MSHRLHYVDDFTFPGSLHPVITNRHSEHNYIIQYPISVSIYANISVCNQRNIKTHLNYNKIDYTSHDIRVLQFSLIFMDDVTSCGSHSIYDYHGHQVISCKFANIVNI